MKAYILLAGLLCVACGGAPKPKPVAYVPPMPVDKPPPAPVAPAPSPPPAPVVEKPTGYRCFVYMGKEETADEVAVDDQNRFVKETQDRVVITLQPWFIGGKTPADQREPLCRQRAGDMCREAQTGPGLCRYEVSDGDPGGWTDATPYAP